LPAYRLPSPYDRPPLRRRASGLALALAVNLGLLAVLLTLGIIPTPGDKDSHGLVVDLLPESRPTAAQQQAAPRPTHVEPKRPVPKPPPIILPVKPTIAPPPTDKAPPWIELSSAELAASDIGKLPKAATSGAGDSEAIGHAPNGDLLYAAEWARKPTDAELSGYLRSDAPDGFGLVACRTIPGNRVDDCVELDQEPHGSHLASAVRQAAWQFHVRPPRKNGKPLVGSWVQIRIDYEHIRSGE
jgi:protein TonB